MSKCPYCDAEIHIEDFFEVSEKQTKKGKIKKRIGKFKGEHLSTGFNYLKMFVCPSCDKILGFSEYYWST